LRTNRWIHRTFTVVIIGLTAFGLALVPAYGGESHSKHTKGDIIETAIASGKFETLVTAIKAADLVETLQGKGPFTVFAPTDEAFAKLPEAVLNDLLKPENKNKLQGILTYHVVPGNVMAADVVKMNEATTVNGQVIQIQASEGGVMIDNASVVKTDIVCTNGVIHVIDAVILPKK
jgi:uncharacterized surface protein with fasciclin (FAS1) repeats